MVANVKRYSLPLQICVVCLTSAKNNDQCFFEVIHLESRWIHHLLSKGYSQNLAHNCHDHVNWKIKQNSTVSILWYLMSRKVYRNWYNISRFWIAILQINAALNTFKHINYATDIFTTLYQSTLHLHLWYDVICIYRFQNIHLFLPSCYQ